MGLPLLPREVLGLEKDVLVWVKKGEGERPREMSGGWGALMLTPWSYWGSGQGVMQGQGVRWVA